MTTEDNDGPIDVKEIRRQIFMEEVRHRSTIPFPVLRNRMFQEELDACRDSGVEISDYLQKWLDPTLHIEEDGARNAHMITSADILDLHLSELRDRKTFGQNAAVYSERTERLTRKVADGLLWALDADEKWAPGPGVGDFHEMGRNSEKGKEMLRELKDKLASARTTVEIVTAVHKIITMCHYKVLLKIPIRYLYWESGVLTEEFLDFLRDNLE